MNYFTTIAELDNVLTLAEVHSEKARYQAERMYEDVGEEKSDAAKLYGYNGLRLMTSITHDYVYKVDDCLEKARELFKVLWEECKAVENEKMKTGGQCKAQEGGAAYDVGYKIFQRAKSRTL